MEHQVVVDCADASRFLRRDPECVLLGRRVNNFPKLDRAVMYDNVSGHGPSHFCALRRAITFARITESPNAVAATVSSRMLASP